MHWVAMALLLHAATADLNSEMFCHQLNAQQDISLEQMEGKWYVLEIVQHREDSHFAKGESIVPTCPQVTLGISDNPFSSHAINVKYDWREDAGDVSYDFYVYTNQPGHWTSAGPQNVSLSVEKKYQQFAGKVYVTKAVRTHVLLTFCSPRADLYSILMSRTKRLSRADREGAESLLNRLSLKREAVKHTCRGGAAAFTPSLALATLLLVLHFAIRRC